MALPFLGWLIVVIFVAIIIGEIREEIQKKKIDWKKFGMLVLVAYILYKIQFG